MDLDQPALVSLLDNAVLDSRAYSPRTFAARLLLLPRQVIGSLFVIFIHTPPNVYFQHALVVPLPQHVVSTIGVQTECFARMAGAALALRHSQPQVYFACLLPYNLSFLPFLH